MTREDLARSDRELTPLVPDALVDAETSREVRSFNENVSAVRRALLEPARSQLEGAGAVERDLEQRLSRAIGVIHPWRRTLLEAFPGALAPAAGADAAPAREEGG